MAFPKFKFSGSFCLTLSLEQFEPLRYIGLDHDRTTDRWVARFCATRPGSCTLESSDLDYFLGVMKREVRRYRTACDKRCQRTTAAILDVIFWAIFDQIERCVDLGEKDCVCPMEWRVHRVEILGPILIDVAWALWGLDCDIAPIEKAIEKLACRTTDVNEQQQEVNGTYPPFAKNCHSVAARADRQACAFFDAVNDLGCNNWARRGW